MVNMYNVTNIFLSWNFNRNSKVTSTWTVYILAIIVGPFHKTGA